MVPIIPFNMWSVPAIAKKDFGDHLHHMFAHFRNDAESQTSFVSSRVCDVEVTVTGSDALPDTQICFRDFMENWEKQVSQGEDIVRIVNMRDTWHIGGYILFKKDVLQAYKSFLETGCFGLRYVRYHIYTSHPCTVVIQM
jgi:hypothetical protein